MTPAGTSNELDVQNEWEENKNKKHSLIIIVYGDESVDDKESSNVLVTEMSPHS